MDYVYVGKFAGCHALKGEIKLKTDFEYLDKILVKDFNFYIGKDKNKEVLVNNRYHNGYYLMLFKDLDSIDKVSKYINQKVYVLKDDLNLDENELVYEDYIGLSCYYNNKLFGEINDIVCYGGGNYVFSIKSDKEILIPFNKHFIDKVTSKEIYFKNLEGFFDED